VPPPSFQLLPEQLLTHVIGSLHSLKNVKKDVTEMRKGTECGIGFEEWTGFEVGDQVQCYEEKSEKRRL
jgi:translation initiation factor IF-2